MVTNQERGWLEAIQHNAPFLIGDFFKVRVGVKTTADDVFIRDNWETLPERSQPDSPLLRRILSTDDAQKWTSRPAETKTRRIVYTHQVRAGKRQAISLAEFPKAAAYFNLHREQLEARSYVSRAKRNWYAIWVPQDPEAWQEPMVIFPDISPVPKFFYHDQNCIVDGNCYWIGLRDGQNIDLLFLVQGVANSGLMARYHD